MKKYILGIIIILLVSCSKDTPTAPEKKEELTYEYLNNLTIQLVNSISQIRRDSGLAELIYKNVFIYYNQNITDYFNLIYTNSIQQNSWNGNEGVYESLTLTNIYLKKRIYEGYISFQERYELQYSSIEKKYSPYRANYNVEEYIKRNLMDFLVPTHKYLYVTVYRIGEYIGIYTATCIEEI